MAEPRRAASVSVSHCEHGTVFIYLHDEAGEAFAVAAMDLSCAADVLESFGIECQAALEIAQRAAGINDNQAVH